jgi:ubiquinone/menaquinone biosynthesis C-methylase UbiE
MRREKVDNTRDDQRTEALELGVVGHYDGSGLLASIEAGMAATGKSSTTVTVEDLGPVDEFHVGGRVATTELCERLGVTSDDHILDVGCGIGGTARFIADLSGGEVTGVDLAPNYVSIARVLTEWTGLADRARYETASALDMPFEDGSFDKAVQLHVGMNIADKSALFREVHRVLRPGGRFGVYDMMSVADGMIEFPVPWATDESMSFVEDLSTYRDALESAGFEIVELRNRRQFAVDFFGAMRAKTAAAGGPPPLGLHLILGKDAPTKLVNMVDGIAAGTIAPVEMICQKTKA